MNRPPTSLFCSGCGASPGPGDRYPFTCPNAGSGDADHVLRRALDSSQVRFPPPQDAVAESPFLRYRHLLHSYHRARAGGWSDDDFCALVRRLDERVAEIDGHGFLPTPLVRSAALSRDLGFSAAGGVWVKDETGNVAGSHKGRHLMGVMLHVEIGERLSGADQGGLPALAVASCGNAALAAAVVAAAARRTLRVFVPVDADPGILGRLAALGAEVVVCPREPGRPGDPTYRRLGEELRAGALPFTCQGNLNGLAIEGGLTLGYEIATDAARGGFVFDHLVVQVGGGALASSCAQGLAEAVATGVVAHSPRIHTVQTTGAHPLERAYWLVRRRVPSGAGPDDVAAAVRCAARHRSGFMWPWETEPQSIATGILDDETYDWVAVVEAMLSTGGGPVVVEEDRLARAHRLGAAAGYHADATGTSGLAGLVQLRAAGVVGPDDRALVLFTGTER